MFAYYFRYDNFQNNDSRLKILPENVLKRMGQDSKFMKSILENLKKNKYSLPGSIGMPINNENIHLQARPKIAGEV